MPDESPNFDQLIESMMAFDQEGQEYMTPVAYAKIRPVHAPYLYSLIKNGKLLATICQCGRKVLNVKETDIYFSGRRPDWPVKPRDDDEEELDEE